MSHSPEFQNDFPGPGKACVKFCLCLFLLIYFSACHPGSAGEEDKISPGTLALILKAEDERKCPEIFQDLLKDGNRAEKARVLRAMGRIGRGEDIQLLAEYLHDPDPAIRQEAVFALGEVGTSLAGKMAAAGLQDKDPVVRGLAAEALAKSGEKNQVNQALPVLDDPEPQALGTALLSIWRLKSPLILEKALTAAASRDPDIRWKAAYCIRRLLELLPEEELTDTALSGAEERLKVLAQDGSPQVRGEAAFGLCRLKSRTSGSLLLTLLQDPDDDVKSAALRALQKTDMSIPAMYFEELWHKNPSHLKVLVLETLPMITEKWKAEPYIHTQLQSRINMVKETAWESLPYFEGENYLNLVSRNLQEQTSWTFRAAMARGVAALEGNRSQEFLFELASNEKDPKALWQMISLFPGIAASEEEEEVLLRQKSLAFELRMLEHQDLAVRSTAVSAAAALLKELYGEKDQVEAVNGVFSEAVQPAYFRSLNLKDQTPDVRLEILKALEFFPDLPAGKEIVLSALKDPDYLVQKAALPLAQLYFPHRRFSIEAEAASDRDPEFYREAALMTEKEYRAYIKTHGGIIEIELFSKEAPLTVKNFIELAKNKFYDGLTWHRVVPGFVIQGGCPRGDGWGGPGWTIRCEINRYRYNAGMVGMALSGKDTGGSQFFITLEPQPHLDGGYTIFGRVVKGLDTVRNVARGDMIESVRIVTVNRKP